MCGRPEIARETQRGSFRDAFHAALPQSKDYDFLEYFAASGCYRNDGTWRKRLNARRAGERRLAATIAALQPQVIVVLLKGIVGNVRRAMAAAEPLA
jgi:hypothetical protein